MEPTVFDYSPLELFQPIWIGDGCCVVLGGVQPPRDAAVCFSLSTPSFFGTGGHPCTRSILSVLQDSNLHGVKILDYRSGSGLMGIYCARFGAKEVVSYNEEEKVNVRALLNAVGNSIIIHPATKTELSEGYSQDFDTVISHQITPQTVREDAQLTNRLLGQGGSLLVSGWKPSGHQFVKGVLGEFFTIENVGDTHGYPIILASK